MWRSLGPRLLLAGALTLFAARADAALVGFDGPTKPRLPLFESGPPVDLFQNEGKLTIGLMHAGWSLAVPLVGEKIGGRKGLWVAGLTWLAASVVEQTMFQPHASPAEHRSDMLTKVVPCLTLLAVDYFQHRRSFERPVRPPTNGARSGN
jgi:hypothetical protein